MKKLRASFVRVANLFFKQRRERELAAEIESHLQFHVDDNLRAGMTPEEARRQALMKLGGEATKEAWRDRSTLPFVELLLQDLRYAMRQLLKSPGFAATAILVLALGIGASTAIFSAVNPILFEPLPYPQASRIAMVWERKDGGQRLPSFGTYRGVVERSRSFEALAVMKAWQPTMTGPQEPERFEGQRVSASYFRVLGVAPVLGRDLQDSDDRHRGPNVVILSDALWRRRFAADAGMIGREIRLDDDLYTVIGIMPAAFENVLAPEAQLWAPLQYDPALLLGTREWGHHLRMVGRLKAGVARTQAQNELDVIARTISAIYEKGFTTAGGVPAGFVVNRLQDDVTRDVKPALLAVLGAVMLVLLIACVNVTNLLLAHGAQRRGEFAVRVALGAGRTRVVRQLLTESLLLALVGGAAGIAVAEFGVRALVTLSPPGLPRVNAIRVDTWAFLFALAITTIVGLAVGVIPALQASRRDPQQGMQLQSRGTTRGHQFTRRALVVVEVALALVLLVSAGLLLRSLRRLFAIDPGFDPSHVLTMQVQEAGQRYHKDDARVRFFDEALRAARRVPGVVSAGLTDQLPLSGDYDVYGIEFENDMQGEGALRYSVTPGYFEAMRIPLISGRYFNDHDNAAAPRVAIINEAFAKRKLPGVDPIGRRVCIRCDAGPNQQWSTIVGVVADVRQVSLDVTNNDAVYHPNTQWYWGDTLMSLVARTRGDAATLAPALRNAIWSVDKDQPIVRVVTMEHLVTQSEAQRRFAMVIFEAFALVALALAATGIYGVLSGGVNERMREIGVRAALGATRGNILALFVRQGMVLTVAGITTGVLGAAVASRALIALLFGVSRLDATTYVGVVLMLLAVSAAACWIPAWRASRVDPAMTLRAE